MEEPVVGVVLDDSSDSLIGRGGEQLRISVFDARLWKRKAVERSLVVRVHLWVRG